MKSLIFHCTGEATIADRRAAFGAINRLVNAWVAPLTSPATNGHANETVPGFEQFMYEHVLPICVDGPISKEFDYSDGQSFLVRLSPCLWSGRSSQGGYSSLEK